MTAARSALARSARRHWTNFGDAASAGNTEGDERTGDHRSAEQGRGHDRMAQDCALGHMFDSSLRLGRALGVSEARFDVIVGRTAYTLIQLQSMILPWMIPVVNTTIFERELSSTVDPSMRASERCSPIDVA